MAGRQAQRQKPASEEGKAWPKTLHLVRHGESTYNVHYAEHSEDPMDMWDAPLTARGEAQAREAAVALAAKPPISLALTSPLSRAAQTCLRALPPAGRRSSAMRYEVCDLLAEHLEASCDIGRAPAELGADFPDLNFAALREVWWYFPEEYNDERSVFRSRALFKENGRREPPRQFKARVQAFGDFLAKRSESTIAAFGHADFFREFLEQYFSRHDAKFEEYWMKNCEVLTLQITAEDLRTVPEVGGQAGRCPEFTEASWPAAPAASSAGSASRGSASRGIAALKREFAAQQPDLRPALVQKAASQRWKELTPQERAEYMKS